MTNLSLAIAVFTLTLFTSCNLPNEEKQIQVIDELPKLESNTIVVTQIDSSKFIIDSTTKLMWMKEDFSLLKGRFLNDWKEIFEFRDEINIKTYGGFSDWKTPTIKQYRTINKNKSDRKKYQENFSFLDSTFVWGNGPYAFWSQTTPNKHTASYISFIEGFATSGNREKQFSSKHRSYKGVELGMSVRLVREL